MGKAKRTKTSGGRKRRSSKADAPRPVTAGKSLNQLLAAVSSDPDNVRAALDLAEYYLGHDGIDKVSGVLRPIQRLYPFPDRKLRGAYDRLLAFGEIHCGQLIEAEQAITRGLSEYPESLDFHYLRCHINVSLGEFEDAITSAGNYLTLRDEIHQSQKAHDFSTTGAHPGRLLDLLGTAYRESGRTEEAEETYRRAIAAEPENQLPYLNLAHLYRRTGRRAEANGIVSSGLNACSQVQELRMLSETFRIKSSVSACMIVRNEEEALERCLESIRDWVDEIIIVDTGSTDNTVEIALSYGARVLHQAWEGDFSKHRNYSIDQATGEWVFVIDADEVVCTEDVAELRRLLDDKRFHVISVNIVNVYGANESRTVFLPSPRFFRRELGLRYEGIVHNQLLVPDDTRACRAGFRIKHYGYDLSPEKMAHKRARSRELLEKQLAECPEDPYSLFNLAQLLRAGENGFAIDEADKIIDLARRAVDLTDPSNSKERHIHLMSLDLSGWAHFYIQEFTKAEEYCRRALALKDHYLDSLLLMGHIHLQMQNFDTAITDYQRYLEIQKNYRPSLETDNLILMHVDSRAAAYYGLGLIAYHRGRRQEAREWLEETLEIDPLYLDANGLMGAMYLEEQTFDLAETHLKNQIKAGTNAARAAHKLAIMYDMKGQDESASEYVDKMTELAPDDASALLSASEYYHSKSDARKGTELLERAKDIAQTDPALWTAVADVLQRVGRHKEAAEAYEKALGDRPGDPATINDLANCYYRLEDFGEAERLYKEAISGESVPSVTHRNLGLTLARLEKFREAITVLERYLSIEPESHEILQVIADLYVRLQDLSAAISYYEKFLMIYPEDVPALFSLSECYLNMGHTDSAMMGYRRVLQLDPNFSPALQRMGQATETVTSG